jgi:hypothetical protein
MPSNEVMKALAMKMAERNRPAPDAGTPSVEPTSTPFLELVNILRGDQLEANRMLTEIEHDPDWADVAPIVRGEMGKPAPKLEAAKKAAELIQEITRRRKTQDIVDWGRAQDAGYGGLTESDASRKIPVRSDDGMLDSGQNEVYRLMLEKMRGRR